MARFLIISGSSAIGQATKTLLEGLGHDVYTTSRNSNRIQPDFEIDPTNFQAVEDVFKQLTPLDGVVNCSGSLFLKPAHLTSKEDYQNVIDASLTTSFATLRGAAMTMKSGGSVIFISSSAALTGLPNHEAIASAKAALHGLILSGAATYAPMNLRINGIAPGLTQTPLTHGLTSNEVSRTVSIAMHPLGRLGTPEDIAQGICFLLDPANSWITGQVLAIDGGLSALKGKMKV